MANALVSCPTSVSLLPLHRGSHGSHQWAQCSTKGGIGFGFSSQACWSRLKSKHKQRVGNVVFKNDLQHGCIPPTYKGFLFSQNLAPSLVHPGIRQRNSHRRYSQSEKNSASDRGRDSEATSVPEVEIVGDDEEVEDLPMDDRFERLAEAMARNDDEAAEQIMQELGNPIKVRELRVLMDGVTNLEENLQELYTEVNRIIKEGDTETAREIVDANYEALLSQLGDEVAGIEQAAMLDILAQLRLSLGDYDEVEQLLAQIRDILKKVGPDTHQPLLDNILGHMGQMYSALGKPAEAVPMLEDSLEIQENIMGPDSPFIIKLLVDLANTYVENDEDDKAIETYRRVISTIEKASDPSDERLAQPLAEISHLLLGEGKFDEAEVAIRRALHIVESSLGKEHWQAGSATCALARAKVAKGQYDEAVYFYRKGLGMMEASTDIPEDYSSTLEAVRTNFGELLDGLERYDEAQVIWEDCLQEKEKEVGEDSPELSPILLGLASALSGAENFKQAESILLRSLKLSAAQYGPDAPQTSVPMEELASVLHHLDKDDEAELLARQALRIRESASGPLHPSTGIHVLGEKATNSDPSTLKSDQTGSACSTLASILHTQGRHEEALDLLKKVLAIQEDLGADNPEIGFTLELIVVMLDALDRKSEIPEILLRMERLTKDLGTRYGIN